MELALRLVQPLEYRDFALPEPLVLIAKLVALASLRETLFPLFLPFVPIGRMLSPEQFDVLSRVLWWAGNLLLFFTDASRTACLLLGSLWISGLLACQPCHSVAHTYVGCLFLVLAAGDRRCGPRLVRAQLVILYAAAGLHKALDADWWNGRYFETLMMERHQVEIYSKAAALLPPMILSKLFGIAAVLTQLALAVLLAVPRWHAAGVATGVLFHGSMVILLGTTFGPFFVAILATYLAFVRLPERLPAAVPFAAAFPLMSSFGGGMVRTAAIAVVMAAAVWILWRKPTSPDSAADRPAGSSARKPSRA